MCFFLHEQLIGSKVTIEGEILFIGNDARRDGGGALYISSFGQILMKYNSKIVFANNTGRCVLAALIRCYIRTSIHNHTI